MLGADFIAVARGKTPADLNLLNCRVLDFFRGIITKPCTVSLYEGYIIGVDDGLSAGNSIDMEGRFLAPGLVDAHVHIESSLLAPREYARLVCAHGSTAVIADPHEIANVLGMDGIRWMLRASDKLPLDVYLMAPSCVPASLFDTSGAVLGASDLSPLLYEDRVLGLGEMMDYPGVLSGDAGILDKISAFWDAGRAVDGHAPGLSGKDLSAYLLGGIRSDHEAANPAEALEKIGKGMWIMARFGSGSRDLESLIPAMNAETVHRMMLCTDDRHPDDIAGEGHIDGALRALLAGGIPLMSAMRMACHNASRYFNLRRNGAVAPGYRADLVAFSDERNFRAELVFKAGRLVAQEGRVEGPWDGKRGEDVQTTVLRDSVNVKWLQASDFRIPDEGSDVRVIEASPGSLLTGSSRARPRVVDGACESDTGRDLLKIFVIERHNGSGSMGRGFIHGFGLKRGALGSTVSHDSHNMIIVGVDDESIFKAARCLNAMKGGYVITDGQEVVAQLALPIAGLMSDRPLEEVLESLALFAVHFRREGMPGVSPLMTLSFMALPVIPSLKITDKGLIDVDNSLPVKLFLGA